MSIIPGMVDSSNTRYTTKNRQGSEHIKQGLIANRTNKNASIRDLWGIHSILLTKFQDISRTKHRNYVTEYNEKNNLGGIKTHSLT